MCSRLVKDVHRAVQCDICNFWNHIKCDKIEPAMYEKLTKSEEPHVCYKCREDNIPFFKLTNDQFITTSFRGCNKDIDELVSLNILPPNILKSFFNEINESNLFKDSEDEDSPINCKYYGADSSLPKIKSNKYLSLFHMNIASLELHKEELEILLSILDIKFSILGITETKLKKDVLPISDYNMAGYNCYHTPTESAKGGAALYIDDIYITKRRNDLEKILYKSGKLESVFVEIVIKNGKNIIVGCIYRHPTMDIEEFNSHYFSIAMNKITNENKHIYLCGDFNIDLMKTGEDTHIDNFFEVITSNLLIPHIIIPSRVTNHSKTLIDNIFSNSINFSQGLSGNLTTSISDHYPQFLIIPTENPKTTKKHNLFKRDFQNFDRINFVAEILNVDWNSVLSIEKGDPDNSFNMFDAKINEILNKYVPLKKLNKKDFKYQLKPWISHGILNSIKRRDKLLRKYINEKDVIIKEDLKYEYRKLRNKIVNLIRTGKRNHFQKHFTENANNIRETWKGIKSIINIKNCMKTYPAVMKNKNDLFTEPKNIAEGFNNYFSLIAKKLQDKIVHFGDFSKYLKDPVEQRFLMESADSKEIIAIIELLNNNKASGPFSIPTSILKLIKNNICYPLKEIINLSFATGLYPSKLKIAKVNPIYKGKGDICDFSSYRPISLLSNINKIFEKLVYARVYSYLNLHNCIYDLQFGFRTKHSTNHALVSLTENIREALDKGNFACGIFVDLQKAFDTVDHQILLEKLKHYGIRGKANEWFKSYLTERHQYVSINGYNSSNKLMNYGVPQGSVLGPLLFLIYINDLHNAIKHGVTHHFADDTNLFLCEATLKKMQIKVNIDLKLLCSWLKANKISLNASKTELLLFRHPNKKLNYDLKIKIDGKKITPSDSVKYLGITIDCHLNWH